MKRHMLVALAFVATTLFAIPALSHAQVTCNLRTGTCTGSDPGVASIATFPVGPLPANTCAAGPWFKAFAKVNLTPLPPSLLPRAAFFTVEYEGTPSGWTVDIGDSPTNDGYGGTDPGDPSHGAEVQVLNQQLTVYNDPQIPGQVDSMLNQQLSLTNGALKFGIADEILAVGQPRTILATPVTKTLFTLPDAGDPGGPYSIYAGFNHVVKQSRSRPGCGARSVTIWTGTNPPGV